jgi:hypothetical protein
MPINIGSQVITVKFFDPVDSYIANAIAIGVRKLGIYTGGYLTRTNDTTVTISVFDCEIGDGVYQVRGVTGIPVSVIVSPTLPYVILRWTYTGSASLDYIDFLGVALGSILTTDIVVGKCNFAGSVLTGFDYTLRTTPEVFNLFLKVEPQSTPDMTLRVRAGRASYGAANFDIVDQTSPTFSAPGSNSRIDLLQISTLGALIITPGVSAVSPTAPDYGGLITLAQVTLTSGQTTISASNIKDVRSFGSIGVDKAGVVLTTTDQTVAGTKTFTAAPILNLGANANNQQITGLCIENRTNDTGCTQTGRIWLRTDI